MSILINGLALPEDAHEYIDLRIFGDGVTFQFDSNDKLHNTLKKSVQLPAGFGRLIDGDEISESLAESATFKYNKRTFVTWAEAFESMIDMIADAPTIIEAERGAD